MLMWINGAFGVGKTTSARFLREHDARWRLFDPEAVGYMLRANLSDAAVDDFQDLPAWRELVPTVARAIIDHTGDNLVAVQTVLRERHWRELVTGLAACGIAVIHVVLDANEDTLRERISSDRDEPAAMTWRLDHIDAYRDARSWLLAEADLVIDTAHRGPTDIAETILAAVPR